MQQDSLIVVIHSFGIVLIAFLHRIAFIYFINFCRRCINWLLLCHNREKEKMREREEAWQHIEDLAVQNPLFDKFSSETNNLCNSQSSIGSPQDDSDSDFNPEISGDATEVRFIS